MARGPLERASPERRDACPGWRTNLTAFLQLALAFVLGGGAALQFSMLGAMGRLRGPTEATWLSLLGSVFGIALVLALRSARGDAPLLPAPFDRTLVLAGAAALVLAVLLLSARGIDPYFAATGLFATAFLIGAAFLVPRIGVALYFSAVTAGTIATGVLLDHLGALGAEPQEASLLRVLGVVIVGAGVVLLRVAT